MANSTLPRRPSAAAETNLVRRPTILAVEDDPALRAMLGEILTDEGYYVAMASSAQEARALLQQIKPDLALLDVRLPDVDGHTLCRELRALPGHSMAILMLTAEISPRQALAAFDAGADDYLRKPFAVSELLAQIRRHLALRAQ